jgi:hypothetical protein
MSQIGVSRFPQGRCPTCCGKQAKLAMFHLQVLKSADELVVIDPKRFCKKVSVPDNYVSESRQMIALARLMKE